MSKLRTKEKGRIFMDKYINDALIGNGRMLASYSDKGELLRIAYPTVDYKQNVDFFHVRS